MSRRALLLFLLLVAPAASAQVPAEPGPLPCKPGVIRPRPVAPVPRGPSPEVLEREGEVAALRRVVEAYRDRVDDAVRTAYRREREAVARKFLSRITPAEEAERARRLDAIAAFRAFLSKRAGDASEAEATFRLAELLFEEASDRWLIAQRVWAAEAAKRREGTGTPAPRPDFSEAIEAWRTLVKRFPDFERRDASLYMIAFALGEQGDARASRDAYETLARIEGSSYRAEAWLRVGEHHFERAEHDAAIAAYRAAADLGPGPFFDKALYKLAWSLYRRGGRTAWAEAAAGFARLVEVAPESPLRGEALQYLAILYADHGGLPAVKAAVAGKPWGNEVLLALAALWYEQKNWEDVAQTYELALAARPEHDDAPLWANRRVLALERLGREEETAAAREELHRRYGSGSVWQAQKAASPSVVATADAVAEPALLHAAFWRHQRAQWTRKESDYAYAIRLYDEYLKRYPGRPVAYDITFYRAESFYFANRLAEAAEAYGDVLEFTAEGPWHAEAAFARFKAREGLVGFAALEEAPASDAAAKPIPEPMLALVKAAEDFTCVAPTDWRVPEALFRAAQVFHTTGRILAARERAEAVIGAVPREDFAAYASTLVVDGYRLEGRYDLAEETARRYEALSPGRTPAVVNQTRDALARVAVEAGFTVAKSLDDGGRHADAAAKWLEIAAKAPSTPAAALTPKALFAAGLALEKDGRSARAAQVFAEVATRHAADPLAEAAAFRRAHNLGRVLEVETAARAYATFALDHPFSADASAAAWNAALLWEAAGRPAEAAAAYERFADTAAAPGAERAGAWLAAGEAWLSAGKLPLATRDFRLVADAGDTPDALRVRALAGLAKAARVSKKSGDAETRQALELQLDLAGGGGGTPESARAAADAALFAAEALYRRFEALPAKGGDPAAQEASVRAKHEALLRAREAYLAIAELGDPDATTQALHRIGEGYGALASAVRALRDGGIDREATAEPLERSAVAALERNLEIAGSARVATEWTAKSRRLLAPLAERTGAPPRAIPREDKLEMPAHDVWAIPGMLPAGQLFASAGTIASDAPAQAGPALARAIAAAVERFPAAHAAADPAALREIENELRAALEAAGDAAAARPRAIGWHDLAVVRDALGDLPGATAAWRKAHEADPELAPAVAGLTAALARGEDPDEAVELCRAWLKKRPSDADVRVNLSGALRRRKDVPAALAMAIEALGSDARHAIARRAAVVSALAAKRPSLALFAARQGIVVSPDDPESWLTLGLAHRESARNRLALDRGRAVLLQGAETHADHARLQHAAGLARLADGDPAGALPLLERAARSLDPAAAAGLAAACRAAGDPAGAMTAARRALALSARYAPAWRTLGLAAWDAGDLATAEEALAAYVKSTEDAGRSPADPVPGWLEEVRAARRTEPKKEGP